MTLTPHEKIAEAIRQTSKYEKAELMFEDFFVLVNNFLESEGKEDPLHGFLSIPIILNNNALFLAKIFHDHGRSIPEVDKIVKTFAQSILCILQALIDQKNEEV